MAHEIPSLSGLTGSLTFSENTVNETPQRLDIDVSFTDDDVRGVAEAALAEGAAVVVAVRPEDVVLGTEGLPVVVADAVFLGDRVRRTLRLPDGTTLRASGRPAEAAAAPGSDARASFPADVAVILPA